MGCVLSAYDSSFIIHRYNPSSQQQTILIKAAACPSAMADKGSCSCICNNPSGVIVTEQWFSCFL